MYDNVETRVHQLNGLATVIRSRCLGYIHHLTVYATPKDLRASSYSDMNEPELNTIREEA